VRVYPVNQFRVSSEFDLPVDVRASLPCAPDAELLTYHRVTRLQEEFPCARFLGRRYGDGFLRAYDVGRELLICAGKHLRIAVAKDGYTATFEFDPADDLALAYARAMSINVIPAICTLLRGDLALHAAGVSIDEKYTGILAPSGTGKSTLLWALIDAGAKFANDDVIPVKVAGNVVAAYPSASLPSKLSEAALAARGEECVAENAIFPDGDEYWREVRADQRHGTPSRLSALIVLSPQSGVGTTDGITVSRPPAGLALSLLFHQTQGLWAVQALLPAPQTLQTCEALLHATPMYVLHYRRRPEIIPGLVHTVRDIARSCLPDGIPRISKKDARRSLLAYINPRMPRASQAPRG
jgi:hypothetical protein